MTKKEIKTEALALVQSGMPVSKVARELGIPRTTLRHWITKEFIASNGNQEETIDLHRKIQRHQDNNRINNKRFREHTRAVNAIEDLTKSLIEVVKQKNIPSSFKNMRVEYNPVAPIGIIQFSDLHINQTVSDMQGNEFNVNVASKRLHKHVSLSIKTFKSNQVTKVVLALTGDLVKNIQHLSEISHNSMSRADTVMVLVDLFLQIIKDLRNEGFQVVVASVVGNESRTTEIMHDTKYLASDNYDLMLHKFLQIALEGVTGITILPMGDLFECVLKVHSSNILMVHGNMHGVIARTASAEKQNDSLVARYARQGVKIDYTIFGHHHSAFISDKFARCSSLVGNDPYATRGLNLFGRASQNSFLVYTDGSINGFKHDLQVTEGYAGYDLSVIGVLDIEQNYKGNTDVMINGNKINSYTI